MDSNTNSYTDKFTSYGGTRSSIQIKALITVVSHSYKIDLLGNTFSYNTGTKGIIYLDLRARTATNSVRTLIAHNKFTQNGGFMDATVLLIRTRAPSGTDVYTTVPSSNANLFCTGHHLQQNTFTQNIGCSQYAGAAVKIECVNYAETSSDGNDRITGTPLDTATATAYTGIDFTTLTSSTETYAWNGVTYAIDYSTNTFSKNVFTENYGSHG